MHFWIAFECRVLESAGHESWFLHLRLDFLCFHGRFLQVWISVDDVRPYLHQVLSLGWNGVALIPFGIFFPCDLSSSVQNWFIDWSSLLRFIVLFVALIVILLMDLSKLLLLVRFAGNQLLRAGINIDISSLMFVEF